LKLEGIHRESSYFLYEYSAISNSKYGDLCTAVIFGDGFAREVSNVEVKRKCPNQQLINLDGSGEFNWWGATRKAIDTEPQLWCDEIQDLFQSHAGLYVVGLESSEIPQYVRFSNEATFDEWRLARITGVDCRGAANRAGFTPRIGREQRWISTYPLLQTFIGAWPWNYFYTPRETQ
jgi:hypothetical protein